MQYQATSSVAAALLLATAACSSARREARIGEIYAEAAKTDVRNPVIVVHGILGSRLVQTSTGRVVWGAFTREGVDPDDPDGTRAIALPLEIPPSADEYDPASFDVVAQGPLDALDLSLFFNVVSVDVYADILRTLGVGGYRDVVEESRSSPTYGEDHYTCYSFFYDWRRDNVENAIRFGRFLERTRALIDVSAQQKIDELRATGDDADREHADRIEQWLADGYRFDVVAHSMGGLIARYFLRFGATDLPADGSTPAVTWNGADEIDRLLIVGTPSLGSLDSLQRLTEGFRVAFFLPHYGPGILGSMPSIYQLLPRNRHAPLLDADGSRAAFDLFDADAWRDNRWGLYSEDAAVELEAILADVPEAERGERVHDYLDWCLRRAEQFHRALDQQPVERGPAELFLFAGDAEETAVRVALGTRDDGTRHPDFSARVETRAGDTTVARYSALADERFGDRAAYRALESPIPWTGVTFLADDHVGLTESPAFSNNSLHILLERRPRPPVP